MKLSVRSRITTANSLRFLGADSLKGEYQDSGHEINPGRSLESVRFKLNMPQLTNENGSLERGLVIGMGADFTTICGGRSRIIPHGIVFCLGSQDVDRLRNDIQSR